MGKRAVLFGGPVDRRTMDDIPEETEYISIPSSGGQPRHARYKRTGDGIDSSGKYLRFEFVEVIAEADQPIL